MRKMVRQMDKLAVALRNPARVYDWVTSFGLTKWACDETHLKLMWKSAFGPQTSLDLDNPTTFNEKLQWLKLHDRNPLYTTLVDKYAVKVWVAERIGAQYVTETYARWERAEDIDVSGLPERFVLKTNHDCGGVAICRDRATFDLEAARRKLKGHLRRNYYWGGREWPYKNVKPCVFAEEYLEPEASGDLPDYKVMCFAGEPRLVQVHRGRFAKHTQDFYTVEWDRLDFSQGMPQGEHTEEKPACLGEMLGLSRELSAGFPQVRVDWYIASSELRFGEMTLFDGSGFDAFDPPEWDERLGSWVDLSLAYGNGGNDE